MTPLKVFRVSRVSKRKELMLFVVKRWWVDQVERIDVAPKDKAGCTKSPVWIKAYTPEYADLRKKRSSKTN